jgi:outer membrane lipoprotein-sorting protein
MKLYAHKTGVVLFWTIIILTAIITGPAKSTENQSEKNKINVKDIINNTNYASYYLGDDGRADISMEIFDKNGSSRKRSFTILRKDSATDENKDHSKCGEQKFYVYFKRPGDVKKMAFMVWKHLTGDDDRWLYLPALDLVKRIAGSDKRTSFVGSHFFYEDVSGRSLREDKHELIENSDKYYVLKNTPLNPGDVEFAYYKMWIYKGNFLPVKISYFDNNNVEYRTYEALKFSKVENFPVITRAKMTDKRLGGHTIVDYSKIKFNNNIPDNIFSERYLRKAPAEYLKYNK